MTEPRPPQHLDPVARSRLLAGLDAMGVEEKKRIRSATESGRLLEDGGERTLQAALLGQQRWARSASAVLFSAMAVLRIVGVLDGRESGWLDVLAAIGFLGLAAFFVRRWLVMHRLEQQLGLTKESFR